MNDPANHNSFGIVAPECASTIQLIHEVMDGTTSAECVEASPHLKDCHHCRERLRAARFLLNSIAMHSSTAPVPVGFTDSILGTVQSARRARIRRRVSAAIGGFVIAASVALFFLFRTPPTPHEESNDIVIGPPVTAPQKPDPAPEPMRLGEEMAKASDAFLESMRTITEPAASTPATFVSLANVLFRPSLQPAVANLEPARKSLADIPEAAMIGFEPVTGSTRKALNRFLRDVSAVKPNS